MIGTSTKRNGDTGRWPAFSQVKVRNRRSPMTRPTVSTPGPDSNQPSGGMPIPQSLRAQQTYVALGGVRVGEGEQAVGFGLNPGAIRR